MAAYNRVVLIGNITAEIDLRSTPNGTSVTDIGLAVNERRKGADGQLVEDVQFIDVTLWGRTAEVAAEYLGKGSSILIEGRLRQDTWEQDGQKRSKLKVVGERMQMLGPARQASNATFADEDSAAAVLAATVTTDIAAASDDIPF
jgi:single-strand DNA-binding protein